MYAEVRIPMMPKGVEHLADKRVLDITRVVRIPMMPKGVEHVLDATPDGYVFKRANSDDAERR